MILFPSEQLIVDYFVDSNFGGQWNAKDPEDPLCMNSLTVYVLWLEIIQSTAYPSCKQRLLFLQRKLSTLSSAK